MQTRTAFTCGLALTIGLVLTLLAPPVPSAPAQEEPPSGVAEDPDEILIENMKVIEDGMKALRKQLSKPEQYPAALALVVSMQESALTCKLIPPPMTIGLEQEERPAFVLSYRKDMIAMEEAMLALELALLEGDSEVVKERYKALRDLEEPAHERFTEG